MKNLLFLLLFLIPTLLVSQTTASVDKTYMKDNMYRANVIPTLLGFQYEPIFQFHRNIKKPKGSDWVLIKIKSYNIDGSSLVAEKEVKMHLAKLAKNINTGKLRKGIKKMSIGDKYRFFIPQKLDYDRQLHVYVTNPITKIYEVELMDILKKDGSSKHPKQTARYTAVTISDDFDTLPAYKLAKQKAFVKYERNRQQEEQMIRARAIHGDQRWE